MTIIHLLVGLGGGGAENFLLELSKRINKSQKINTLVVSLTSIDTIAYKYKAEGIEYVLLNITGVKDFFSRFRYFLQILGRYNSCVIHAHMFHAGMVACLAKLFKPNIRVVFTLHTNYVKQYYRRVLLLLTKSFRNADIIFSPDSRMWYHKENAITIPNGIETSRFNLEIATPDEFTFLFLGRLSEPKNPLYLIELVNQLKEKYKFKILVSGDGPLRADLEQKISKYGLGSYFKLLGFQNDIPKLLSSVHCLIMPSLWEGMPMAILEAGAAGVPIITTPVGSIPSILNNTNANVGSINKFSAMVEHVLLNYDSALCKAKALQKTIHSNYDIAYSAKKHLKLYSRLLPAKPKELIPVE